MKKWVRQSRQSLPQPAGKMENGEGNPSVSEADPPPRQALRFRRRGHPSSGCLRDSVLQRKHGAAGQRVPQVVSHPAPLPESSGHYNRSVPRSTGGNRRQTPLRFSHLRGTGGSAARPQEEKVPHCFGSGRKDPPIPWRSRIPGGLHWIRPDRTRRGASAGMIKQLHGHSGQKHNPTSMQDPVRWESCARGRASPDRKDARCGCIPAGCRRRRSAILPGPDAYRRSYSVKAAA